jgi:hypothetical protein
MELVEYGHDARGGFSRKLYGRRGLESAAYLR